MIRGSLVLSFFLSLLVFCAPTGASLIDKLYEGVPQEFSQLVIRRFFSWYQSTCSEQTKTVRGRQKIRRIENELKSVTSFSHPVNEHGELVSPLFSWKFKDGAKSCYSVILPSQKGKGHGVEILFDKEKDKRIVFEKIIRPRSADWNNVRPVALFGEFILNVTILDEDAGESSGDGSVELLFLFDLYPGFLHKQVDVWTQEVLTEFYFKPRALRFEGESTVIVYYP